MPSLRTFQSALFALALCGAPTLASAQSFSEPQRGEIEKIVREYLLSHPEVLEEVSAELSKRQTGKTLYLLDEPTTGLHFDDVRKLLDVLHRLTDLGNTIIIIEHNLDVVRSADWVIDLGPEGGEQGGHLVVQGTPEQVARCKKSYTGQALAPLLASRK